MYHHIRFNLQRNDILNLYQLCLDYTKSCDACFRINNYRIVYAPPKRPRFYLPMQYVFDLMEMKKSDTNYNYVLVGVDCLTRFVWLNALITKEADEVSEHILDIFTRFGFPEMIKTDNGTEFVNAAVTKVLQKANTIHKRSIAHNHHENGLVERQIRTVRDILNKFLRSLHNDPYAKNWDTLIPAVEFAMNARVHSDLIASPFALMFGRNPMQFALNEQDSDKFYSWDTSLEVLLEFWKSFSATVSNNIFRVLNKRYDSKTYRHVTGMFHVGQFVGLKRQRANKAEDNFIGPYKVIGIDGDNHYWLKRDGEQAILAPSNFLKLASNIPTTSLSDPMDLDEEEFKSINDFKQTLIGVDDKRDATFVDSSSGRGRGKYKVKRKRGGRK